MKKIYFLIMLCGFVITAKAQKQSYQEKRATTNTQIICDKLSLNETQKSYIYSVLIQKYEETAKQINGKDLSDEEKKTIYINIGKVTYEKLAQKFSKDEIKEINDLMKTQN